MSPSPEQPRAPLAFLAVWLSVAYVPASLVASPQEGGFLLALAVAVPPTLLLGLGALPIYYVCRAMPLRPAAMGQILRLQLPLALLWSALWLALLDLAARLGDALTASTLAGRIEERGGLLFALGAVLYFAVVVYLYLLLSMDRARESERRAAAASVEVREAQLAQLKAQVHPHFLFNCLHAISALTTDDPKLARELCVLLADFLRRSLTLGELRMVTLAEELELARTYLDIEKIRLGDRLTFELQVSPPAGEVEIPALLLQPLVENAITHGIATCTQGGTLALVARTTPSMLEVTITNPFDPQAPPRRGRTRSSTGMGLANVSRRIAACYTGASLSTRRDLDRFKATLTVPARTIGDSARVGSARAGAAGATSAEMGSAGKGTATGDPNVELA